MAIAERFEKYEDEFLMFEKIPTDRLLSKRPDLHLFLVLDKLVPGEKDIVCSASHDEIFLEVDPDELDRSITDDRLVELIRCGLRYDDETDSLAMFT